MKFIFSVFALKEDLVLYIDEHWELVAPYMLHYENKIAATKHAEIAKLAKEHYFGKRHFETDLKSVMNLTYLAGDSQIVSASLQAAELQSKMNRNPVWYYYYSYRAAQSYSDCRSNTSVNLGSVYRYSNFNINFHEYS